MVSNRLRNVQVLTVLDKGEEWKILMLFIRECSSPLIRQNIEND